MDGMGLSRKQRHLFKHYLAGVLLGVSGFCIGSPANALIPYVYEPSAIELKGASLGIARTAAQLLKLGQPKEAARFAKLAVRLQPEDERLWSVLAEAQLRNNQLDAASQSLARAKQLNPNKAGLWFAEASLALRASRPADAVTLLERGIEIDPKNAAAYFDLGNARIMQSKLPLALKAFEKATALKPTFWEALNNQCIVLYEMNKTHEAISRWRRVLNINRNAEPMLALAAALNQVQAGNPESLQLAKTALANNPNYVSPQHQKEQLWGAKLRMATSKLLANPGLQTAVERADANADASNSN